MIGIALGFLLAAAPTAAAPTAAGTIVGSVAPTTADTVVMLPEVRVERERSAAARRSPTGFVAELRPDGKTRALSSLPELLSQAAGIHVQQYGGLGAFSTVSLRGAPSGQVSVFLDGTPLTSATQGVVNLSDLPVTAIERIEIYRGPSPLGLGAAGAGGAVNFVTLSSAGLGEARMVHGSFDTWEARAAAGGSRGPWRGLLHLGYQGSEGDFLYHDDNGTPFNASDDSLSRRANNRFDAADVLGTLTWKPLDGLRATLRHDLFHKRQGMPGLAAVPARHPRLELLRNLSQLSLISDASLWRPRVELRGSLRQERSRFDDPHAELGLGRHQTDDRFHGRRVDLEIEWAQIPGDLALQAGAGVSRERSRLADAGDAYSDPPPSWRSTRGVMAGLQWRPLDARVVFHAAHRWDELKDERHTVGIGGLVENRSLERTLATPQLGVRAGLPLGLELKGNWSRANRAPDFLELFGNQGAVLGNPALRPEQTESWDAGIGWRTPVEWQGQARIEWAHFVSHSRDLILYIRNSPASVRAQNISAARVEGDELTLGWTGPLGFGGSVACTWQSARDRGSVPFWYGKQLPQRPGREIDARLGWSRGRLALGCNLHALGDNFLDRYNQQRVDSRAWLGASASYAPLGPGLRLTLEAKNLTDDRTSDVAAFPLPGRSWFAAIEWMSNLSSRAVQGDL